MRRLSILTLCLVLSSNFLFAAAPAKAAVNIDAYRSAAIQDLDELYDYYDSDATWNETVIRGISSPQGVLSYFETLVADADGMSSPKYDETRPGDTLPAKATITYWYQACQYLKYMISANDPWKSEFTAFGGINVKVRDAFKDYIALENARIKKDPNWDSRFAWYSGSNSEKEPGFFLARLFAMTMGYVNLYDRKSFVVGTDGGVYGPNNPCLAASSDIAVVYYESIGNHLVDKVEPWGRGPLTSNVREQGKTDAFSGVLPADSTCYYSLNAEERAAGGDEFACQPALKTTYVGSPSGSGDLNFISYLKSFANTLVQAQQYWRDETAKLNAAPAAPVNTIKGNAGGTVLSLPLPLSNVSVEGIIGRILNAILGIVGAIALLMFVWGGLSWMLAAGSTEKIAKAKKVITWSALGLLAIFSSYAILNLIIQTFSKA